MKEVVAKLKVGALPSVIIQVVAELPVVLQGVTVAVVPVPKIPAACTMALVKVTAEVKFSVSLSPELIAPSTFTSSNAGVGDEKV